MSQCWNFSLSSRFLSLMTMEWNCTNVFQEKEWYSIYIISMTPFVFFSTINTFRFWQNSIHLEYCSPYGRDTWWAMHLNIAVHSELWLMSYVTASCMVLGFGSSFFFNIASGPKLSHIPAKQRICLRSWSMSHQHCVVWQFDLIFVNLVRHSGRSHLHKIEVRSWLCKFSQRYA